MIATATTGLKFKTLEKDLKLMGSTRRTKHGRIRKRRRTRCSKSRAKVIIIIY